MPHVVKGSTVTAREFPEKKQGHKQKWAAAGNHIRVSHVSKPSARGAQHQQMSQIIYYYFNYLLSSVTA
jgi:hypothetical protein